MALNKIIEIPGGFSADYVKVTHAEFDFLSNKATLQIHAYKDAATRQEDVYNIACSLNPEVDGVATQVVVDLGQMKEASDGVLTALYDGIKQLDFFSGATDC